MSQKCKQLTHTKPIPKSFGKGNEYLGPHLNLVGWLALLFFNGKQPTALVLLYFTLCRCIIPLKQFWQVFQKEISSFWFSLNINNNFFKIGDSYGLRSCIRLSANSVKHSTYIIPLSSLNSPLRRRFRFQNLPQMLRFPSMMKSVSRKTTENGWGFGVKSSMLQFWLATHSHVPSTNLLIPTLPQFLSSIRWKYW